jgi:hypothetical protein
LKSSLPSQQRGKGDHGRVIRAQPRLRIFEFKSHARACFAQLPLQFLIATDAAADCHKTDPIFLRGSNRLAHQNIDNCLLEGCAEVSE